jgi:hypothetical protein
MPRQPRDLFAGQTRQQEVDSYEQQGGGFLPAMERGFRRQKQSLLAATEQGTRNNIDIKRRLLEGADPTSHGAKVLQQEIDFLEQTQPSIESSLRGEQEKIKGIPMHPTMQRMSEAGAGKEGFFDTAGAMWDEFVDSPDKAGFAIDLAGEQIPNMAATLLLSRGMGGPAMGMAPGAAQKAAQMAAVGGGAGAGSFLSTYGPNVGGYLDQGESIETAQQKGRTRSATQAAVDAATGALVPVRIGPNQFVNIPAQTALQMAGGGGGEYLAAKSVGENPEMQDVVLEGALEAIGLPGDVAAAAMVRPTIGQKKPAAPEIQSGEVSTPRPPRDLLEGPKIAGLLPAPAIRLPDQSQPPVEPTLALPAPRPSEAEFRVSPEGTVTRPTESEVMQQMKLRQEMGDIGLTPDVIEAQRKMMMPRPVEQPAPAMPRLPAPRQTAVANPPAMPQPKLPKMAATRQLPPIDTLTPQTAETAMAQAEQLHDRMKDPAVKEEIKRYAEQAAEIAVQKYQNRKPEAVRQKPAPVKAVERQRKPVGLLEFLASIGGLRDDRGDLKAMNAELWHRGAPFRRRLVSENGQSLDYAREAAQEAGYGNFETQADLLDAIDMALSGRPVWRQADQGYVAPQQQTDDPDYEAWWKEQDLLGRAEQYGINTENRPVADVMEEVAEREAIMAEAELADAERRKIDDSIDGALLQNLPDVADKLESNGFFDEFDIPFEDEDAGRRSAVLSQPQYPAEQSPAASGPRIQAAGRPADIVATGKDAGSRDAAGPESGAVRPATVEQTPAGEQAVIPGAEKIPDRQLAERKMEGGLKASKPQKAPGEDGGLFDTGARQQTDIFDAPTTKRQWDDLTQSGQIKNLSQEQLAETYQSLTKAGVINKPVGKPSKLPTKPTESAPQVSEKEPIKLTKRGDFYEAYGEDARLIAKELELAVTKRDGVESVGLPAHSLEGNIEKLAEAGIDVEKRPNIRASYFEDIGYGPRFHDMNYDEQKLLLEEMGIQIPPNKQSYATKLSEAKKVAVMKAQKAIFERLSGAEKITQKSGPKSSKTESSQPAADYTSAEHRQNLKKMAEGELSIDEIKALFQRAKASKEAILAEAQKLTKDQISKQFGVSGRRGDETKDWMVKQAYSEVLRDFYMGDSFSWSPFEEKFDAAVERLVMAQTQSDVDAAIKRRAERDVERKKHADSIVKSLTNPQTLEEYRVFANEYGVAKFTDEQLANYDALVAEATSEKRKIEKAQAATVKGVETPDGIEAEIIETKHTQKGHDLFVVRLSDRVEKDVYNALNTTAKRLGGYYSSYRGNGATPGFQFTTRQAAESFVAASKGETVTAEKGRKPETRAEKLRAQGEKLIEAGEASMGQERKVNTHRRATMAAGAEANAAAEIAMGKTMKAIADKIESGTAGMLENINARTEIETLHGIMRQAMYKSDRKAENSNLSYAEREELKRRKFDAADARNIEYPFPAFHVDNVLRSAAEIGSKSGFKQLGQHLAKLQREAVKKKENLIQVRDPKYIAKVKEAAEQYEHVMGWLADRGVTDYMRVQRLGLTNMPLLRQAVREYSALMSEKPKADPIKEAERALVGKKWEGYFPTPASLAERMADELDVNEGHTVLEPSAGKGSLIDAVVAAGANPANVDALEIVTDLQNILKLKGYNVVGRNFLEHEESYDRIIMNPPFENGQDIDHVRHAYSLLKPGGRIAAIMSEGPFYRSDKKATEFRDWLESVGGSSEKLPEGSFKDSDRSTGVATRMVIIDKPEISYRREPAAAPSQRIRIERKANWTRNEKRVAAEMKRLASQRFGDGLKLDYVDSITDSSGMRVTGFYRPGDMTVGEALAVIAMSEKPYNTLNHEGIHHLRRIGALDGVWDALSKVAANRWIKQYRIEEAYPNDGSMTPRRLRELHVEEAIAEAFADYVSGKGGMRPPAITEAFRKIKAFFDSLRNYLKGEGFTSWRSIFEDIASGKSAQPQAEYGGELAPAMFQKAPPTESEAFKKWFGDSKVVDAEGKPLVVYHGTGPGADIESFLPKGGRDGEWQDALKHFREAQRNNKQYGYFHFRNGSFFSPFPEYAGNYTAEGSGAMYPAYIKAENPVYFDQKTKEVTGTDPNKTPDALILHVGGVINEVAVIDPTQVKSIFNQGTFDPSDARILFQRSLPKEQSERLGKTRAGRALRDWLAETTGLTSEMRNPKAYNSGSLFVRKLVQSNDGVLKYLENAYNSKTIGEIRKMLWAEAGADAGTGATYEEAVDRYAISRINRLGRALKPFDKKEWPKVTKLLQNPALLEKHKDKPIGKAAQEIRKILDENAKYLNEGGFEFKAMEGYFPRVYDAEKVARNENEFLRSAMKAYQATYGEELDSGEMASLAEAWLGRILLQGRGIQANDMEFSYINTSMPRPKFTKPRSLSKEADEIMRPFLQQDPFEAVYHHVWRSTRMVEFKKRFGGEKWPQLKARLIEEGLDGNAISEVVGAIQSATGTMPDRVTSTTRSVLSWARLYTYLRFLDKTALYQIQELMVTGMRTGNALDSLQSIKDTLKALAKTGDMKETIQLAEDVLGITGEVAEDLVLDARFGGALDDKLPMLLAQKFFRGTFLTQATAASRIAALKSGQRFMLRLAQHVSGDTARRRSSEFLLRELGIPKGREAAFSRWLLNQNNNPQATEMYHTALARFTDQVIMRPKHAERQRFAGHPVFSLFYQLQAYIMSFSKNVLLRMGNTTSEAFASGKGYTMADRIAFLGPALALPLMVAVAGGMWELRDEVLFKRPDAKKQEPWQDALKVASASGLFGAFDPYLNMFLSLRYRKDPANALSGPLLSEIFATIKTMGEYTFNNSPRTNSAERAAAKDVYDMGVKPAANGLVSLAPLPALVRYGIIQTVGHPETREAFVSGIAGKERR